MKRDTNIFGRLSIKIREKQGSIYVDDICAEYKSLIVGLALNKLSEFQRDEVLINHYQIRELILTLHCHTDIFPPNGKICSHDTEILKDIRERMENIKRSCK